METAPVDGLQTPSGLETPSGMASVVSTVAGGLETPDFLELRKTSARHTSDAPESGPRSLYQVVPEKQASVRGLMGSERGYDISQVTNPQNLPVLGEERGSKVCEDSTPRKNDIDSQISAKQTGWIFLSMLASWRAYRKKSYGGSTNNIHEVRQGLQGRKKTSQTWSRRKWRRRNKRWIASGRQRKGRNLNFDLALGSLLVLAVCFVARLLLYFWTRLSIDDDDHLAVAPKLCKNRLCISALVDSGVD